MERPFENRVAVVTGGSRGIGKVIALELAAGGADVVITGRSEEPNEGKPGWSLREAAEEIERHGGRVLPVVMDVARDDDIERLVAGVLGKFGRADILVNNAARMGAGGPFLGGDPALFDEFLTTNLRAPYLLAQKFGSVMAEHGGGVIVNITSGAARMPAPLPPRGRGGQRREPGVGIGYGVTKAGLNRWAAGVAEELRESNIAIVNVDPGLTRTERNRLNPRPGVDYSLADPPEVTARAVAFICRDHMPFTGQIVVARACAGTRSAAGRSGRVDGRLLGRSLLNWRRS